MTLRLDPGSPIPLYHQLAEGLRYRIATGALRPGDSLPPLRTAANEWDVNLHTVRHAYATLAAQGLVRTEGRGTVVLASERRDGGEVTEFLQRVVAEAQARFSLGPSDLVRRLGELTREEGGQATPVYVVECSETQAEDLAAQLASRLRIPAVGWSLERPGTPPAGARILATYFHYNDIRQSWPERFPTVQFVAIRPDTALAERLRGTRGRWPGPILVAERQEDMARNIAADLGMVVDPEEFTFRLSVHDDPARSLDEAAEGQPVLFAPRVWGALTPSQRSDPRATEIRYVFDLNELDAIVRRLDWGAARRATPITIRRGAPNVA